MSIQSKSIVEDTLLKIRAVEEAISENAKGILASTMKEEISELVKESLNDSKRKRKSLREQEEVPVSDEEEVDVDVQTSDEMGDEEEFIDMEDDDMEDDDMEDDDMEDDDMGLQSMSMDDNEMPPLDMTSASPEEVLKVFKAMGDEDGIIVKKDGKFLHLSDNETNKDYLIQTEERKRNNMRSKINEEVLYEIQFRDEESTSRRGSFRGSGMDVDMKMGEMGEMDEMDEMDEMYGMDEMDEMYEMDKNFYSRKKSDETIYELEMDEMEDDDMEDADMEDDDEVNEVFKAKGKLGKMKFSYPKKLKKGVSETPHEEEEFSEWNEEEEDEFVESEKEDAETSEASRTMTYRRRSERGRVTAPRQISESKLKEIKLLKEKNEEYKKALDFFRNKLNEVAVFNSNLAYSTRLFTEHSTTKQEKINILRRFDNVETLKESKNLYKSIKNELDNGNQKGDIVKESIETKVTKTPQNGSSTNLIESKTYENPQFLRMKDLMTKIK